jgi:hypothetical protein
MGKLWKPKYSVFLYGIRASIDSRLQFFFRSSLCLPPSLIHPTSSLPSQTWIIPYKSNSQMPIFQDGELRLWLLLKPKTLMVSWMVLLHLQPDNSESEHYSKCSCHHSKSRIFSLVPTWSDATQRAHLHTYRTTCCSCCWLCYRSPTLDYLSVHVCLSNLVPGNADSLSTCYLQEG